MGLLRRIARLLDPTADGGRERAADPERLLDGTIAELSGEVERLRRAVAAVVADEKRLKMEIDAVRATARDWESRAAVAVADRRDDLARAALLQRHDCEARARALQGRWAAQQASADGLKAALRRASDRVAETRRRVTVLAARQTSAQANRAIAEKLRGHGDAAALMEQLDERILQAEAETEAALELGPGMPAAAGDGELAELERQRDADAALARLKAELAARQ